MCVNINDPQVLDSQVIETDEMMEVLGLATKAGIRLAIQRGTIPDPMDNNGRQGANRWTVGMLREWNIFLGKRQLEISKQRLLYKEKMQIVPPAPQKVPDTKDGILGAMAELGISSI